MAWTELTRDDLLSSLSAAEVEAHSRSAGFADAVDGVLAQTAAAVRGFVRAGGRAVAADAALVPPSLVPFAMDFAVFRLLKRFRVPVGDDRRRAYDAAMDIFKEVAAGKMAVEPAEEGGDEAAACARPAFVPARPERRLD